jgi:imidazolonepropionase-like amidohydrolase
MKKIILILSLYFALISLRAQGLESTFAIVGGTAHIGDGTVIEDALVLVRDGVIEDIRSGSNAPIPKLYRMVEAKGKHIYPGLIAAGTRLGLEEIEAVRATRDFFEVGEYNAHIRSLIAYNTDSKIIPTLRFNGVLTAQVRPYGGVISGSSSIMQLYGWNWEDAVLKTDDGIWMEWPRQYYQTGWWAEPGVLKKNEDYENQVLALKAFFSDAQAWNGGNENLRLQAMKGVFSGKQQLFITAHSAKEILSAVEFAQSFGIQPIITGATQAWLVADYLAAQKIPVIVGGIHGLPEFADNDIDQPFKNIRILKEKGVLCSFFQEGSWQQRNIAYMAGTAAAYGLDKEAALQLLTGDMAKILKVDDKIGTLSKGKLATLFITEGDVLDMKSSQLTNAWVAGRPIELNDMQQQLYFKFREKYRNQGLIKP